MPLSVTYVLALIADCSGCFDDSNKPIIDYKNAVRGVAEIPFDTNRHVSIEAFIKHLVRIEPETCFATILRIPRLEYQPDRSRLSQQSMDSRNNLRVPRPPPTGLGLNV